LGNNFSFIIQATQKDRIEKWFEQLSEDGNVEMPLQETFWSKCYGSVKDKFGVTWQFSLEDI
jgi:PhnB protein